MLNLIKPWKGIPGFRSRNPGNPGLGPSIFFNSPTKPRQMPQFLLRWDRRSDRDQTQKMFSGQQALIRGRNPLKHGFRGGHPQSWPRPTRVTRRSDQIDLKFKAGWLRSGKPGTLRPPEMLRTRATSDRGPLGGPREGRIDYSGCLGAVYVRPCGRVDFHVLSKISMDFRDFLIPRCISASNP